MTHLSSAVLQWYGLLDAKMQCLSPGPGLLLSCLEAVDQAGRPTLGHLEEEEHLLHLAHTTNPTCPALIMAW